MPLEKAAQIAERYNISLPFVYKLASQGMPSITIGRARRFDPDATDEWVAEQQRAMAS